MDGCRITALDEECWLDLHAGGLPGRYELLDELIAGVPWEQETINLFGRKVQQPRLTAWFGIGLDSATRYRTSRTALPWPASLEPTLEALREHTGIEFNSALANLYRDGADSVAWHADDEPALGRDPVIASVSLGTARRFVLRRRDGSRKFETLLEDGDVLVMGGAMQRMWLHAIPKMRPASGPRINLTFRAYDLETIGAPAPASHKSSSGPVVVVTYDRGWKLRFDAAERNLRRALGDRAARIEHIGSTAVPGLAAKPVIDVQVSVTQLRPVEAYSTAIETLGYLHRPHPEVADREFFRPLGPRSIHIHVVAEGSPCEREHLLVRDFLRTDEIAAARYGELKRGLAAKFRDARQDYQQGKDRFLRELIVDAENWALQTAWVP